MKILLKIINGFFVTLGVIFFILMCLGAYVFIADPFGIKPFLSASGIVPGSGFNMPIGDMMGNVEGGHMNLSPEQKKAMGDAGIDSDMAIPVITPKMEECFIEKLGADRIKEIESGGTPSAFDIMKAGSCLNQ